jgi:hypothetical protein
VFWLNAANPTGAWKLHKETCRFCKPVESKLKGLNQMKNKGGWFNFDSYQGAFKFFQSEQVHGCYWQICKACNPEVNVDVFLVWDTG